MEDIFPSHLIDILMISITLSFVLMVMIQKLKSLPFVKESWQIWFLNLIFSFAIGVPFGMTFYDLTVYDSIWVGLFTFIGAPSIFDALKNQKILTYKPKSLSEDISVVKENLIKR